MATTLMQTPVPLVDTLNLPQDDYDVMKEEGEWSQSAVTPTTTSQGYNVMPTSESNQPVTPPPPSSLPQQRQPSQQSSSETTSSSRQYPTPSRTLSRGDTRSVYSSATSMTRKLMFATPAKYTPMVWGLLAVPLVAVLISMIMFLPRNDIRTSGTAWALGWTLLLILVVYMAILPKQLDVRANGTIGIKTALLTFHIDGVVRAYQAGVGREDFLRPRIKFGTTLEGRVVLRRNHGKWDVVVSPQDVEGFLNAVEEMIKEHGEEDSSDVKVIKTIVVKDKPNLASTGPAIV